ncbi:GNAT family N-acetyltransferase [Shouchella lehensis]|uniref:Acetyltransferase n=2 Tax=Shouchella lehensis TaxID=300825 RepID=A0A060LT86_9BACI|nr:GNAT family N-acetyltransferase [Shouchella lehensis]AIC93347.1 acetyltransferase [Shouchella lehensis G1]MBG9782900.1 hypothetical protein [Shouchella lehensis]RQW22903.1 GNAT family N-acetyltransferase [Bacillus sp. C1-1]TES49749.1 GNAT family N-acetyltransferase [Shouchella lehensis]
MNKQIIVNQEQLELAFSIRKKVFVDEQHCPIEDEFDAFDDLTSPCTHVLVYYNEKPVGTGRVRQVEGKAKLERICLLKEYRKHGLGKEIITLLEEIAREMGCVKALLHGQTHAEGFYEKLGYVTTSDVFEEDGIPHVKMEKSFQ